MSVFRTTRNGFFMALALAGLFFSAAQAKAEGTTPNCYVLAVGVDRYQDIDVPDLSGCVNDANNLASRIKEQQGKLFGTVQSTVLADQAASRTNVVGKMNDLTSVGKAGDFVAIILSGHGDRNAQNGNWSFLPNDFNLDSPANTSVTDTDILSAADTLAKQGKTVWIIVDACFAGQLRVNAQPILDRYQDPRGGGIILMTSSATSQTSAALGNYSAFAHAVDEALSGSGDINHDGFVTLREIRHYVTARLPELIHVNNSHDGQDGEIDYSMNITEDLALGMAANSSTPAYGTVGR